jgi:hypothetical protein
MSGQLERKLNYFMNKLRRFLTIGVMAITVLATLTAYAPVNASASAGDLIKMDGLSSVYYLGSDGKRYVFPNSEVYFSWYNDFSGVVTIPASELQSYPLGGNVTMRPGTKLVKITTDPSVYAVEPNGVLRKIQSEAQAAALYGTNWSKKVVDVADAFFTNYTISSALPSGSVPAGSLVKSASAATVYYYDGTNYRAIADESAFNANRFSFSNVITVSSIATTGTAVSSAEFVNVAQNGATTGVVVTGSGLMVSLSSATPAAANVPENGVRIPFTTVNLTASSDGASTINSIVIRRTGLSSYNSFDKIWAEENGITVASKKSLNSNDEATLVFSPALTIAAGQTQSIDIIGSFTANNTLGGNAALSIVSASSVNSTSAAVTGSFPITGNSMSLTSYQVTNLGIQSAGNAAPTVKVGDTNVELGGFQLGANSPAKDVTIKTITLKNNGVEDLTKATANLYLEQAGVKVSTATTINGRFVTFTLNNGAYDMLKDDGSKVFKIKGDILAKENSDSNDSLEFSLNKSTDLNAIEKGTGFGANVVAAATPDGANVAFTVGSSADSYTFSKVTISSGAVNLSKKTTSPSDTTIVKGQTGLVALVANFKADEAMTADGLNINYGSGVVGGAASTTAQFQNAKVYLNGALVDSFDPSMSTSTSLTQTLDSSISLNAGDNEIKILVDSKSDATNGSIKFWLGSNVLTSQNPEYVVSGNKVDTTSIGGSAEGALLTVGTASLTVARSDGYGTGKSIVKGSTDVSLGKFTIKAVNDDITITSAQLGANTGSTSANSIYDAKFFVDGVQTGNTVDFGTSGASFSSLNFVVKKDQTRTIEIFGSFDSSAVEGSTFASQLVLYSQDSKGKTISPNGSDNTTQFAISGAGTMNVAVGGNTPTAALLSSNSTEQEVAEYKFTATNDSASLTELQVYNYAGGSLNTGSDSRVSSVRLYDGTTLIDSFTPVLGGGKFTITNDAAKVLANQNKTLSIKVVLNSIDNDQSATNKALAYAITAYKFKSSNGSETVSPSNLTPITANTFVIRKTVPTIAYLALPDTTLNAGAKDIAKFSVSADAAGDVTVNRIALDVATTTNATISTTSANTTVKINGSFKNASSVTLAGGQYVVVLATPEVISAGTSKTFEIQANTSVTGQGSDSITAKLSEDASPVYTVDGTPAGNFAWSDGADVNHYTWANGYRVAGLTTNTWTMSK